MAHVLSDSLDFSAYMRETDASAKVRKASAFADELAQAFVDRGAIGDPTMTSTPLARYLEFRPGEVTLWAGYNGHRKSMFTSQVAADLCMQDQRILVASMEMQPGRTLARMARQVWATNRPSEAQLERFMRWSDGRLWLFDHMGRITPDQMIAVAKYFADELQGQHVFIDSMMMVCASEEHIDEQKQFATDVCRFAQETNTHLHLVAHARKPENGSEDKPPTKYSIRGAAALSDQVSNVVTIWANKPKVAALQKDSMDQEALRQPDAAITVEKQRNGDWEGRIGMWFHPASLRFDGSRTASVEPYPIPDIARAPARLPSKEQPSAASHDPR